MTRLKLVCDGLNDWTTRSKSKKRPTHHVVVPMHAIPSRGHYDAQEKQARPSSSDFALFVLVSSAIIVRKVCLTFDLETIVTLPPFELISILLCHAVPDNENEYTSTSLTRLSLTHYSLKAGYHPSVSLFCCVPAVSLFTLCVDLFIALTKVIHHSRTPPNVIALVAI